MHYGPCTAEAQSDDRSLVDPKAGIASDRIRCSSLDYGSTSKVGVQVESARCGPVDKETGVD
jgi:hypothetical protein